MRLLWLVFIFGLISGYTESARSYRFLSVRAGASPEVETNDAFAEIGQFLLRMATKERSGAKKSKKGKDRGKGKAESAWAPYEERHILRALNKLSAGQSALKSMDGATHRLRNAFSDKGSSLEARYEAFLDSDDAGKTKKGRKEAAKLYEYVSAVERFFQGSEVLQAAVKPDEEQQKEWFREAGLEEVTRVRISENKVNIIMYVLKPVKGKQGEEEEKGQDDSPAESNNVKKNSKKDSEKAEKTKPRKFEEDETVLAFVESASDSRVSLAQVLRVMGEEPLSVPLTSVGFVQEEVSLQPTFVQCACTAMQKLGEVLKCVTSGDVPAIEEGSSAGEAKGLKSDEGGDEEKEKEEEEEPDRGSLGDDTEEDRSVESPIKPLYEGKIRIFGYSAGAAVGAYVGMILEGTLDSEDSRVNPVPALKGAYKDRMKAVLIAPPPCISRSIVSQGVISLLCGDDVVPRAAPDAINRLRRRVLKALQSGAGKGGFSGLGYTASAGFLKDLKSVTGKSVKTYTSGEHDLSSLRVPGRVFYLKARSHKEGASLQRVMRGNWREDMLWQLNEVLLSDRMLRHHELDYHIKTLDRL